MRIIRGGLFNCPVSLFDAKTLKFLSNLELEIEKKLGGRIVQKFANHSS